MKSRIPETFGLTDGRPLMLETPLLTTEKFLMQETLRLTAGRSLMPGTPFLSDGLSR